MEFAVMFFFIGLIILSLAVQLISLIRLVKGNFSQKIIWVLIILFMPLIGSLLFYCLAQRENTTLESAVKN